MPFRIAAAAGFSGAMLFVGSTIVGGFQFAAYDHASQFISETYASGTPWGPWLRGMGFIPAGVLLCCFGVVGAYLHRNSRTLALGLLAYAVLYGLGTVVASLAPCDFGCDPQEPSPSAAHLIHFAVGGLTYLLTPLALLMIAFGFRDHPQRSRHFSLLFVAALLMLTCTILLFSGSVPEWSGLVQRVAEGAALSVPIVLSADWWATPRNKAMIPS